MITIIPKLRGKKSEMPRATRLAVDEAAPPPYQRSRVCGRPEVDNPSNPQKLVKPPKVYF